MNRVALILYLYLILPVGLPVLLAMACERLLTKRFSCISETKAKMFG